MCSIVGIVGNGCSSDVVSMLDVLSYRGPDGCGVYSDGCVYFNDDIVDCPSSSFMLGHNLLSIVGSNELQPFVSGNLVLASNAELYNYKSLIDKFNLEGSLSSCSDCEIILKVIEYFYHGDLKDAVLRAVSFFDGDYAFCVYDGVDYIIVRDDFGVKPLYYSCLDDNFAFASEEKALRSIGFSDIKSLSPSSMIYNGKSIQFRDLYRRDSFYSSYDEAFDCLKSSITSSVQKRVQGLDSVAVLFSGGVDSTLVAVLAKSFGVDVSLYSVGTENSQDLKFARKTAESIGLPIKVRVINQNVVEDYFEDTLNTIEDTNLMKIGVAMTIKLTSELAGCDGHKVILSGQGADELFVGYNRYKKKFDNKIELYKELDYDLNNIHNVNLERDDKATMSNSVELRVPFLDKSVVSTALKVPIDFSINSTEDNIRKRLLRDVALSVGVPEEIAYRPKKAAQYGTGIDKIIKKKLMKNDLYKKMVNYN